MDGSSRILVPKASEAGSPRRIKFVVKTTAVTFGVRGTDFVVDAHNAGKDVELHTLEGSVEAAKSVPKLIEKDTVAVDHGFTIHVLDGRPISDPKGFDVSSFANELNRRQPTLVSSSATLPKESPKESAPIRQKSVSETKVVPPPVTNTPAPPSAPPAVTDVAAPQSIPTESGPPALMDSVPSADAPPAITDVPSAQKAPPVAPSMPASQGGVKEKAAEPAPQQPDPELDHF
jgi:hypothetical protein